MPTSLSALKQNSASLAEKLKQQIDDTNSGGYEKDARIWSCQRNKDGNGYAVIRFLPPPPGEDDMYVRVFDHGFQGDGGWYIEKSLTSIGLDDPVSEYNSKLWNSGDEDLKKQASKQKRRTKFYSNILVIDDPANPSNNGKVFLFAFGKKIFDMINDKMVPQFKDEESVNVFDFWDGANFKLKIVTVDKFPNYDKSSFDAKSALFGGDNTKLEAVWKSQHSLKDFLDPKNYKSYDELKKKLHKVLGLDGAKEAPASRRSDEPRQARSEAAQEPISADAHLPPAAEADDDPMAFFKKFA